MRRSWLLTRPLLRLGFALASGSISLYQLLDNNFTNLFLLLVFTKQHRIVHLDVFDGAVAALISIHVVELFAIRQLLLEPLYKQFPGSLRLLNHLLFQLFLVIRFEPPNDVRVKREFGLQFASKLNVLLVLVELFDDLRLGHHRLDFLGQTLLLALRRVIFKQV